jgi:hypothetical protein
MELDTSEFPEGGWFSSLQNQWNGMIPGCAQPGCNRLRRMWSGVTRQDRSIRLQGLRYCSVRCFESAACEDFARACAPVTATAPPRHRIPLGLLMLSRQQLTAEQLRTAIDAQTAAGQHRLGDWLEKLGFATEQQVTAALGLQWSCPVLASRTLRENTCGKMVPYRLLQRFRMLPVQFVASTRVLLMAFCDGIDHTALYTIEQMLDCRTQACVMSHTALEYELERMGRETQTTDRLFDSLRDPSEMARITRGYVNKLGTTAVRMAGCGEYIWVRLEAGEVATLLFQRPGATPAPLAL